MGLNFIHTYQSEHQTSLITQIQNVVSLLCNTFFVIALLALVIIAAYRKLNATVFVCYIAINAYIISVEKQAFHDPRPFHYDQRIEALEWRCQKSFGFPSGHSWMSVLLYEPIISDMFGVHGIKKIALVVLILTGVLVPLSRLYLGSHSSDQIVSGVLHSLAMLLLYRYYFQEKMFKLMTNCLKGNSRVAIFILNTIFLILSMAAPLALY